MKATRHLIIDDIKYDVPMYVHRILNGWQVRINRKIKSVYFSDSNYGGTKGSFVEAVYEQQDLVKIFK